MKKSKAYLQGSYMLLAVLLLFSCKKQITDPGAEALESPGTASSSVASSTTCKPASYSIFMENAQNPAFYSNWSNLVQKFYTGGLVSNIKANYAHIGITNPIVEPGFTLFWGTVTRAGNMVTVRDEVKDLDVLKVMLDGSGRPAMSWFYNRTNNSQGHYRKDTTSYYYDAISGRLDSIWVRSEMLFAGLSHPVARYDFSYDMHGNLLRIVGTDGEIVDLFYDYSRPVSGLQSNLMLGSSFKLVEHMELLIPPMHHVLNEIQYNGSRVIFTDYSINGGLVESYKWNQFGFYRHTYYTGWECGSSPAPVVGKEGVRSLEQFKDIYSRQ
jgi:hypothetical protein